MTVSSSTVASWPSIVGARSSSHRQFHVNHLRAWCVMCEWLRGILSLTRSNTQGRLGFLGSDYWRRINVALSRARFGLTIIRDVGLIRGTSGALRTVLEYVEQHPADCIVNLADND